jgi:hypothetical protein
MKVKISLLGIELAKELFMLELEQAKFNCIPDELSQTNLPLSFRFYDPIIVFIKQQMNRTVEQYNNLKNALTEYFGDEIQSLSVLKRLGIESVCKQKAGGNDQISINYRDIMP